MPDDLVVRALQGEKRMTLLLRLKVAELEAKVAEAERVLELAEANARRFHALMLQARIANLTTRDEL